MFHIGPDICHPLDVEADLLQGCVAIIQGRHEVENEAQANVLALAAVVLRYDAPEQAAHMKEIACAWFAKNSVSQASLSRVREQGWIRDLSWLRNEMTKTLLPIIQK
ncbi:MAG: hypothetical protein FWF12_02090 [Betaproteobacteria bacterium]|nr:hypothetical protein [Betaproteobacteria bacterium]